VLSGAGADDLFDGEPRSLATLAWNGAVVPAVRAARALRGFDWERPRSRAWSWVVRPNIARIAPRRARLWLARRSQPAALPEWAGSQLHRWERHQRELRLEELARDFTPYRSARGAELLRVYLGWLRHQEEVGSGIERRDPYLDRGLARHVEQLPPAWLLHRHVRRGLFREALRDRLPPILAERMDKARAEPAFRRWIAAAGGLERLRTLTVEPLLAELGLVEPPPFAAAFEAFAASPGDGFAWASVWPALCVEAFLRRRDGRPTC
jgi:hypothetical protein